MILLCSRGHSCEKTGDAGGAVRVEFMQALKLKLVFALRNFPGVYRALRAGWRCAAGLFLETLRLLPSSWIRWGPPKGWFSEVELLRQAAAPGEIILPGQPRITLPPDSLRKLCGLRQDEYQPWPVFWTQHRDARLVGATLVRRNEKKQIALEAAYGLLSVRDDAAWRAWRLPPVRRLEGNWTSLISRWSGGYYHWLMDVLPRLAVLSEFPPDTRLLAPPNLSGYQRDALQWLGLSARLRPTTERHLVVENFFFSSPTAMTGCYDPYAVAFLRRTFLGRADTTYDSPRKFFVQRVGVGRGLLNEPEVLEFFRERGWACVDTAQLTLSQQIQLFSRAEAVCALHGAALTNLVWCRPGCQVLELVARTFLNGVYEGIAQAAQADHRFLLCEADARYRARVDLRALAERLDG